MNTLKKGDNVPCHITQGAPIILGVKVIDISESMAALEMKAKSTHLQCKYGVDNDNLVFTFSATFGSSHINEKAHRHDVTEVKIQSFFGWKIFVACYDQVTLRIFLVKEPV